MQAVNMRASGRSMCTGLCTRTKNFDVHRHQAGANFLRLLHLHVPRDASAPRGVVDGDEAVPAGSRVC